MEAAASIRLRVAELAGVLAHLAAEADRDAGGREGGALELAAEGHAPTAGNLVIADAQMRGGADLDDEVGLVASLHTRAGRRGVGKAQRPIRAGRHRE